MLLTRLYKIWSILKNGILATPTQESLGAAARMLQSLASTQVRTSKIILIPSKNQQNHSRVHHNPWHRSSSPSLLFSIVFVLPIISDITFTIYLFYCTCRMILQNLVWIFKIWLQANFEMSLQSSLGSESLFQQLITKDFAEMLVRMIDHLSIYLFII